jgi:hypothetical protein
VGFITWTRPFLHGCITRIMSCLQKMFIELFSCFFPVTKWFWNNVYFLYLSA